MNQFHLLEHTADIGIEATADSREGLAKQNGLGLKILLFGDLQAKPIHTENVSAEGNTVEETLVNWLNELLFLMADKLFIPAEIAINHYSNNGISAAASGEYFDPDRHQFLREIKAVTHHQTRVGHEGGHWKSVVYLDL